MARSTKKKQKAALKKRRKDKARKGRSAGQGGGGDRYLIRRARNFPIYECWINDDWNEEGPGGLNVVSVARQQPDGSILVGSYLLDVLCLGLKNTAYYANLTLVEYRDFINHAYQEQTPETCSTELAHQMIYEAIDYAAQFGFKPQRDFKDSQYILEPRDTLDTPYDLTFGQDNGKPLYINGPFDNVDAILAKLNKNPGRGNYDYLAMVGDPFSDQYELDDFIELSDMVALNDIKDLTELDYFMVPYDEMFPEAGKKEYKNLPIRDHESIPPNDYVLVESFCPNPDCENRHVMLEVVSQIGGNVLGAVDFDFDTGASAQDDLSGNSDKIVTVLNETVFQDEEYLKALLGRYEKFKAALKNPTPAQTQVLEAHKP